MEQVIAAGAKQIIAAGCCGASEDGRNWGNDTFAAAMELAVDAAVLL